MNRHLHDGTYRIGFSPRTFSPQIHIICGKETHQALLSRISYESPLCDWQLFSLPSPPARCLSNRTGHAWSICQSLGLQEDLCPKTHNHTTHASESAQRARVLPSQLTAVQQCNFKLLDIQLVIYFKTQNTMVRNLR